MYLCEPEPKRTAMIQRLLTLKNLLLLTVLLLPLQGLKAQESVTFTAEAPRTVVMGQQFNLVYTANAEVKDLRIPEMSDFEILMGPSTSTMSSTSIINGKVSNSVTYRITYVLYPKKTGTFTINGATATIKKETHKSNSLTIKVLAADQQAAANAAQSTASQAGRGTTQVGDDQIFIRAVPSKTTVFEQEGLTVTYKLYTRVDISGFENPKFPEFKGFMAQEIELPANQQWDLENYNGSNYRTAILKQTVLYPRETGNLTIDKGSFDVVLQLRVASPRRGSIFDDFFDTYQEVKKTLYSNPVTVHVKSLPFGKPADYSGMAGQLSMTSTINATEVTANDAVTIKVTLTGNGNLKMLPTPDLTFPQDFEVYDPKVENRFTTTAKGVSGSKVIEYLVIPRYAGTFEIPAATLSYFDLSSGTYKTLSTKPYTLKVAKGKEGDQVVSGNFSNKEQVRLLGSDIRYLKTGFSLRKPAVLMLGQTWYWLTYALLLFFFCLFLFIYRKQAKANADISRVRNRKANKVAVKRLKLAARYLAEKKGEAFYEELLKALWGYTSDKLTIPLSRLTKETIDSELAAGNVSEALRGEYAAILQACEYARYAPAESGQAMDELYKKTLEVINKMENTIKK